MTQCNPEDVIPALRERFAENLQRSLTTETFLKRYSANTDGDDYRVLAVHAGNEVRAAIVYRTATRGKDIRAAVIMEFGYRGEDQAALHFALVDFEKRAIGFGCEVILSLSSARALQSLLRSTGYFNSNETYVLMKKGVPVPDHLDDWYFTFSDHDAF